MRIQVLGPVSAWRDGVPLALGSPQRRAVLALLAVSRGLRLPFSGLADALWGERFPVSAANVVQTHIKHLRHLLEPERPPRAPSAVLPRLGDGYALRVPDDVVDLLRFRGLVAAADTARRDGDEERAAALLAGALGVWQQPPLADLPFLAAHPAVVALAEERRGVVARFGDVMIAAGRSSEALPVLEEAAAAQPLDEDAQTRLIRAYEAVGRRDQAVAVYRRSHRRLADELGVDPGPGLSEAFAAVLRRRPGPPLPAARGTAARLRVARQSRPHPVTRPLTGGVPTRSPARSAARSPAQLPADVPGFSGRDAELSALDRLSAAAEANPTTMAVSVLSGTAGVGKTALAVRWAHRARARFPDGQLYVNLRGYDPDHPLGPGDALTRFLTVLGVAPDAIPLDVDERASRYRTEMAERRMLVVLDNALSEEQVRPLLPGSASCSVLVTSRDSLAGLVVLHGARRIALRPLPTPDALTLLRTLIGARVTAEPGPAAALAAQCVGLPLALRIAAELAAGRPELPLAHLVTELTDEQRRLDHLDTGGDPRAAVQTVFSWSYRRLPAHVARTFRLLSLHPGPDIDAHAVAALTGDMPHPPDGERDHGPDQTRAAAPDGPARSAGTLALLARAHLLQPAGPGRYGTHDLLRAYGYRLTRAHDSGTDRQAALTRLFDHYLSTAAVAMEALYPAEGHHRPAVPSPVHAPPIAGDPHAARAWLDTERPTLAAICAVAAGRGSPRHAVQLAAVLFRHLDAGHHTEALEIHHHALRAAERTGDTKGQAHALTNLGCVYWRIADAASAADHLVRALDLHRRTDDRAGQARTLSNLGNVHWRRGRLHEAARCHRQALTLYRDTGDQVGRARTLTNLGNVFLRLGDHDQAVGHQRQALALHDLTGDRIGRARTLSHLGNALLRLGRCDQAAIHQQQAVGLFRELGHPGGEAYALSGLGDIRLRQGAFETAAGHQRRALDLFRENGERYGEASALNGLAEALYGIGHYDEALAHHSTALMVAAVTGEQDQLGRARAGAERIRLAREPRAGTASSSAPGP
ncbi:tetratricopeptide repeat protein [Streptomyces sp. MNU89]|uniref:AfsR/SARP family transcriptional regulator n=1 Tax=Streptomyces sp. MNU89 TaxID=2560025 RepID=UPI001E3A8FC6|nr:tetratricopeptide repeat protein [Streptomyces sp. MNU89]MCC9738830.1 tetratricopeptide repeat protein [Streptomyces sp. MNU89]